MSSSWRVTVDREVCIGSGMCVMYAPGTFEHDASAKAIVFDEPSDPIDVVETAVEGCPTGALRLQTDETGA